MHHSSIQCLPPGRFFPQRAILGQRTWDRDTFDPFHQIKRVWLTAWQKWVAFWAQLASGSAAIDGKTRWQQKTKKTFEVFRVSIPVLNNRPKNAREGSTRIDQVSVSAMLIWVAVYARISHIIPYHPTTSPVWLVYRCLYKQIYTFSHVHPHTHTYIYIYIWSYMHIVPLFLINLSIQSPFLLLSTVPLAVHERFVKLKRMTSSRARQAWSILVPSMPEICWESDLDLSNMGFSEAMQDCVRWYDMVLECIWCGRIM